MMPCISVLMSVYNEPEEWMREAIDSILGQTFTDLEFIIVNDNPERKLNQEILSDYAKQDKRIVILENEENVGLTKSLNRGLKVAKGKYIARMDADDISLPQRFIEQYKIMENNEKIVVCGTDVKYFGKKNRIQNDWIKQDNYAIKAQMLFGSCFIHPTVMIRKEVLDVNGITYDESYRQAQDYRLWEVLMVHGEFYNIKKVLLCYRLSDIQVTVRSNVNQLNYARMIRRRLIDRWLKSNAICFDIPVIVDFAVVTHLRRCVMKDKKISLRNAYCNVFIRLLYQSPAKERGKVFLLALKTGDVFSFSLKNVIRLLQYVCGLRENVVW